jgi:hypothetical protein
MSMNVTCYVTRKLIVHGTRYEMLITASWKITATHILRPGDVLHNTENTTGTII